MAVVTEDQVKAAAKAGKWIEVVRWTGSDLIEALQSGKPISYAVVTRLRQQGVIELKRRMSRVRDNKRCHVEHYGPKEASRD